MNVGLVLPLLIPFFIGIVSLLARGRPGLQQGLSLVGMTGLLGAGLQLLRSVWRSGIQVSQMGNWPAPFGITLAGDLLSATLVVLTGLVGLVVVLYSGVGIDRARVAFGYYPLLNILLMGVNGAFLTGDLFNLYVWFEVLLIASFVLLSLGGSRAQLWGTVPYLALNLLSSTFFLTAVGLLYGLVGTLNMADLARQLGEVDPSGLKTVLALLFLVAFGLKAAIFPLFFWLPASYHTPPTAVSAVFGGLLTKVGVYALIRVFTLLFRQDMDGLCGLLLALAGGTMLTGVLGALAQTELRRILSFNLISHIGYMLMGLALFTPLSLAGAIFYLIHHILVKTNLFLVSGVVAWLGGSEELSRLGDLSRRSPAVALLFLIPALALSGFPPLSGFWPKLALLQAGLQSERYGIVVIALLVSLLTLLCMARIWAEAFWKEVPEGVQTVPEKEYSRQDRLGRWLPVGTLSLLIVALGLVAQPIFELSSRTAEQLLHPTLYIETVLGEGTFPANARLEDEGSCSF